MCIQFTWGFYENADGDSVGLMPGFRFYTSNKVPEDADNTGPQTSLQGTKVRRQKLLQIISM